MDHRMIDGLMRSLAPVIRDAIGSAVAPVQAALTAVEGRLAAVEARAPESGPVGEPGPIGPVGPPGNDGVPGKDGRDGKDADPQEVEAIVSEKVGAAIAEAEDRIVDRAADIVIARIPVPKDGKDADPAEMKRMMAEMIAALPLMKGEDGKPGEPGKDGRDGKDGVGLASALLDRDGNLVVTRTDGSARELGRVVGSDGRDGQNGADGAPGKDGRDGFALTDFKVSTVDDGRTLRFEFASGDVVAAHDVPLAVMLDRGVYRAETEYKRGDGVTYDGSWWSAQVDNPQGKPGTSKDWRLTVKKGRDGRDGKDGAKGEKGDPGQRGEIGPRGIPA